MQAAFTVHGRTSEDNVVTMLGWLKERSKPTLPAGKRVYAIGDVHGRLDLFDELVEAIRRDNQDRPEADVVLVLLGDLIDRGPDSRSVVARARTGVAWAKTVALMGNHEEIFLDTLDGNRDSLESWLRYGGDATLQSWGVPMRVIEEGTFEDIIDAIRGAVNAEERSWLSRMRSHIRIGDYYFVHAGIRPGVPLDKQIDEDRLWIRQEFLGSRKKHGAIILHGHSITENAEVLPNRIGIDTGAYITGRLTALGLEREERWFLSTGYKKDY
jgi:serine/threonine protein phosphatase 1